MRVPAQLRFVPTRVPNGYRYAKWRRFPSSLEIDFVREGRRPTLAFIASTSRCTASAHPSYRFGSLRVSFESDRYTDQFWRCARDGAVTIEATIRRTDGVTAAKRRAVALMVAWATPLR